MPTQMCIYLQCYNVIKVQKILKGYKELEKEIKKATRA